MTLKAELLLSFMLSLPTHNRFVKFVLVKPQIPARPWMPRKDRERREENFFLSRAGSIVQTFPSATQSNRSLYSPDARSTANEFMGKFASSGVAVIGGPQPARLIRF